MFYQFTIIMDQKKGCWLRVKSAINTRAWIIEAFVSLQTNVILVIQWNPALQPPLQYGHLVITATFFAGWQKGHTFSYKKTPR